MAWFRFRNQTHSINKNNALLFGSLQHYQHSLTRSFLSVLPFSTEGLICHFCFKREIWLVSRHHDTGFLCDPVELPVFQQKDGPTQQRKGVCGGLLYSRCQLHSLSPGLTLSQPDNPTRSSERAYILTCWLVVGTG